jgi:hypothetical protein
MPTYAYAVRSAGDVRARRPPGRPRQIDTIDGVCAKERGGHEAFTRSHLKGGRASLL